MCFVLAKVSTVHQKPRLCAPWTGDIELWDVSQGLKNDHCCKAHTGMINSVAGCGAEV